MARKKKVTRKKVRTIHISEIVAGAKLLDGLVGVENIMDLDFAAMGAELKRSITNPTGPGGLVDDATDALIAYAIFEMMGRVSSGIFHKRPGITAGNFRISL